MYDVPSGRLIDWLQFDRAVTSLSMSPSGDLVGTCHTDSVGVYLWANRTHFANVFLAAAAPPRPKAMRLPDTAGRAGEEEDAAAGEATVEGLPATGEQLAPGLVTFSTMAAARWQTLANLDVIRSAREMGREKSERER